MATDVDHAVTDRPAGALPFQQWYLLQGRGGYFALVARHSGKCLDVQRAGTQDGVNVRQWACVTGRRNQEWRLT
ncbi:RICIN domain-containing protein [Streptosporangium sp. NBC_01639]|uniref:RICIN domain-containing protein n=1 Tax=Streptosporangium sp. NBC_01639 TaxID=2975948 RepID=UPI003869631C